MKNLFLRRVGSSIGTFGVLLEHEIPIIVILEPPDKNNEQDISCIPEGSYICRRVDSPKYGDTFEITDVEGRSHILFHWGNWLHNTKGCPLTGEGFKKLSGKPAVTYSKRAFKTFMDYMEGEDEFPLTIQNTYLHGTLKSPMGPHGASLK